jgi:hypothetical protein
MSRLLGLFLTLTIAAATPALAQQNGHADGGEGHNKKDVRQEKEERHDNRVPRANNGRIPPPPQARVQGHSEPERDPHGRPHEDVRPHVSDDHWYGHERVDDRRFHLDHPFAHGRFARFGPSFRYRVIGIDRHHRRFWFPGGFLFEVAPWDWAECENWCWQCGDDFVVYEDPDHIGWYLLYNSDTGVFVHVQFVGIH